MSEQTDQTELKKVAKLDEHPISYQCTLYKSKYNPEFVSDSENEVNCYDAELEKIAQETDLLKISLAKYILEKERKAKYNTAQEIAETIQTNRYNDFTYKKCIEIIEKNS